MNPRITLQAFQEQLVRKLADSAQQGLAVDWLGISVGADVRCLLPLAQAGEIAAPTPLQPLPHARPWVLGAASVRGSLTLVADLAGFLGLSPGGATAQAGRHWVSLNPALGVNAAFQVERLLGLHGAGDLRHDEGAGTLHHPSVRQVWRDAAGRVWHELDLVHLSQSDAFLDVRGSTPS